MKLEVKIKDPNLKLMLDLANKGNLTVRHFKTKVVFYVKLSAPQKSKFLLIKIMRSTDSYNLMSWN
jgi:hypothetical protein